VGFEEMRYRTGAGIGRMRVYERSGINKVRI